MSETVSHDTACTALVLPGEDDTLLMQFRCGKAPRYPLVWAFFGGSHEPGEGDIACAQRELQEELEIDAQPGELSVVGTILHERHRQVVVVLNRVLRWGDFKVNEGAGAGFFRTDDMQRMSLITSVRGVVAEIVKMKQKTDRE